jgi:hypothetical protein
MDPKFSQAAPHLRAIPGAAWRSARPPAGPGRRHDLAGQRALARDHDKLPVTGTADRE